MRAVVWTLLMVLAASAHAAPADDYNAGNAAYRERDYAGAIDAYQRAATADVADPALYYNLGNAHLRAGHLGQAILNYRRAAKIDPDDEDIRFNLDYALQQRKAQPPTERPLLERFLLERSPATLTWLAAAGFWLLIGTLIMVRLRRHAESRWLWLSLAGLILLLLIPLAGAATWRHNAAVNVVEGVVLLESIEVKSGPSEDDITLFELREGLGFEVLETRRDWARIGLPGELEGWIPRNAYGTI